MSLRNSKLTHDDVPVSVPAVVSPRAEWSLFDWSNWSAERERQRLAFEARERAAVMGPIYPAELARALAEDHVQYGVDWRYIRPTLGAEWDQLLRSQPELDARTVREREDLWRALLNGASRSMQGVITDLRIHLDLVLTAHECAAYRVGVETGKLMARTRVDARGRIRHQPPPHRTDGGADRALRLHLNDEKGGA